MRDIILLRANYFMVHFMGYFEWAKTFLTPKHSYVNPILPLVPTSARAIYSHFLYSSLCIPPEIEYLALIQGHRCHCTRCKSHFHVS
jgi:hypothetical protein